MVSRPIATALVIAGVVVGLGAAVLVGGYFASRPDPRLLYRACIGGPWPDEDDARSRAESCSQALQTRRLRPDQVALARLTRGVARTMLGSAVASFDDYRGALQHYDGAIDPTHPDAIDLFRRAKAEQGLGLTDRATVDYDNAIRLDPANQRAYLDRGTLLAARAHNYRRAIADFNRALELEPTNANALIARGDAYSQVGDFAPALADLDRAIVLEPGHAHPLVVRGVIHARQGKPELALQDYDAALHLNEHEPFALMNRAVLRAADGKFDLVIRDLDASIAANDKNALAFYNRGYAHFSRGDYAAAVTDYDAALKLDDDMGLAHLNRCLARVAAGQAGKDDLAGCDTALKLMPLSPEVRESRGFVFLKLGQLHKAVEEYDAALAISANRAQALYGRALAECRLYRTDDCTRDKAAALALDPGIEEQFKRSGVQ
jgi:tetratricopeptide (TPR) repeat protein